MAAIMAAEALSPTSIAQRLVDPTTRTEAMGALEDHSGAHEAAVSLAAAPALTDVLCRLDAAEVPHALFQRVGLLRGGLMLEAEDSVAMYGAFQGDGRFLKEHTAPSAVGMGALNQKTAEQLDLDDARSFACGALVDALRHEHGWTGGTAAAGFGSAMEWVGISMAENPMTSAKRCPTDDKPIKMLALLVELLQSGELPDLAIIGATYSVQWCLQGRPAVAAAALELGVIELVSAQLSRVGSPADWLSTARSESNAGRGHLIGAAAAVSQLLSGFGGSATRPDLDVLVSSGMFDSSERSSEPASRDCRQPTVEAFSR